MKRILAICLTSLTLLSGCSLFGGPDDDVVKATDQVLYERAMTSSSNGNYANAIRMIEALEINFPFSEYTKSAQLELMYAYYRDGQPESAVDAAQKFMRENPRHPNVDYAYYIRGLVYFERDRNPLEKLFQVDLTQRPPSDARKSFNNFSQLVQKFPDSQYTPDARARMIFLRNRLANYELHVARYYMGRGAYIAAASRAKAVVEDFPQATATSEALQILSQAYGELGIDELSADVQRVLEQYERGDGRSSDDAG